MSIAYMDIDRDLKNIRPFYKFIGVHEPETHTILYGPYEFGMHRQAFLDSAYQFVETKSDEMSDLYESKIKPYIEDFIQLNRTFHIDENTHVELTMLDCDGRKLKEDFPDWKENLVKYLTERASVIKDNSDIYFINYDVRVDLQLPEDKTPRRECLENEFLVKFKAYKMPMSTQFQSDVFFLLLFRGYKELDYRCRKLYFWILIVAFASSAICTIFHSF